MKRYAPLDPKQSAAIDKLGLFFDPTTAVIESAQPAHDAQVEQSSITTVTTQPKQYLRAVDLLSAQQKVELESMKKSFKQVLKNILLISIHKNDFLAQSDLKPVEDISLNLTKLSFLLKRV